MRSWCAAKESNLVRGLLTVRHIAADAVCVFRSRILLLALLLPAWAVLVSAGVSRAGENCDRVLCYFAGSENEVQWRIYDPVRATDKLFLKLPRPETVRWDSSLTRVEYRVGNQLFKADWKLGTRPHPVARLPELPSIQDWWFNPDSLCWQLFTMIALAERPDGPRYQDCRAELWQSSRDGKDWHFVVAGAQDCEGWYYEPGFRPRFESGPGGASRARGVPMVTSDDLTHSPSPGSAGAEPIESSSPECDFPLYYAPSRTIPGRGVSFRYLCGAPEPSRVISPVHLVDREHGVHDLLCGPDPCPGEITDTRVSEECGLLLVSCGLGTTRLVDIKTGRDVILVGASIGLRIGSLVQGIEAFWGPPLRR